jgi:[NiFe] hydrogenase diaphorase moiety large subunit
MESVIFSKIKPYEALEKALKIGREKVLEGVCDSNLRGRGGAGFPTGVKWNLVANTEAQRKYVICNADEGEPGTFKDRILLSEQAELMLEGMLICAFAVSAEYGFIYLRGEYKSLMPSLEKKIRSLRKQNLLGNNIKGKKGFNFEIEIRLGSGAYICGEETALIESLEGSRGEPRSRPPFPVNTGYSGYPTTVNNVETFAVIPHIILKGAKWFKSIGTEKSSGTKILSVSGDCKTPGVYEVPYGTSLKEIIKLAQGGEPKAVIVGGASGICVPPGEFKRKIAFEDLSTGGSVIIIGKRRNLLQIAENILDFFAHESCGQCTPCREGIPVLQEALKMIKTGRCSRDYFKDISSLAETMQLASKCGLGQTAPNVLFSILDNFKGEYKLLKSKKKEKVFHG